MNLRKLVAVSACGASLSVASLASAQQVQPRAAQPQRVQQVQGQPRAGQVVQQTQWQNTDHQLATCIAIGNQTEVAIAKIAEEKAKSKDVKEFAQMLVKDHTAFLQKLQKFAPEATQEGYLNDQQETTNENQRTSATQPRTPGVQVQVQPAGGQVEVKKGQIQQTAGTDQAAGAEAGQPLDFVQLHREIAEECIRSAKQGMSKKDGKEFDECFIGFQIAAHAEMKNKLTVLQRHASSDLAQVIGDGIQTTERHMKKAEGLIKDLADSGSSVTKRDRSDDKK